MYSTDSIATLTARIAWAAPMQPTSYVLTTENAVGTSGRVFRAFHAMAIVENVAACMPASDATPTLQVIDDTTLNAFLSEMREQAVLKVLSEVFESETANSRLNAMGTRVDLTGTDYSSKIETNPALFDSAIGYQVAFDVLELMLTTSRSNERQRVGTDRATLLVAQQGYRDGEGNQLSDGVLQRLQGAIKRLLGILFPDDVKGKNVLRNASYKW